MKQEHCEEITKHLCMMDYYTFEMQGAVLDRTKTLATATMNVIFT
ncbi:MAG: L-2-amino-thiazoline-4-carboxylic acid hydrolase [Eubacterium sp.]|nr:L-2-amino-thiazoline-4-carboxylic acid hydrolase [Eubacterium sp.]